MSERRVNSTSGYSSPVTPESSDDEVVRQPPWAPNRPSEDPLLWFIRTSMAGMPRTTDSINFLKRKAEGWRAKNAPNIPEKVWHFRVTNAIKAFSGGYIDQAYENMMRAEGPLGIQRFNLVMDGCLAGDLSWNDRLLRGAVNYARSARFAPPLIDAVSSLVEYSKPMALPAPFVPVGIVNKLVYHGLTSNGIVAKAVRSMAPHIPGRFSDIRNSILSRFETDSEWVKTGIVLGSTFAVCALVASLPKSSLLDNWFESRRLARPIRVLPTPR